MVHDLALEPPLTFVLALAALMLLAGVVRSAFEGTKRMAPVPVPVRRGRRPHPRR